VAYVARRVAEPETRSTKVQLELGESISARHLDDQFIGFFTTAFTKPVALLISTAFPLLERPKLRCYQTLEFILCAPEDTQ
jgi:hypothetical protein